MVTELNLTVNSDIEQVKELVKVKNLVKHFPVRGGILRRVVAWVQAVDHVSFTIREGETLGLVGESGCGKSTVGNCILRLLNPTSGSVELNGDNIHELGSKEMKVMRRNMQVIFQDPYSSLNPRKPIGDSILAGLKIHNIGKGQEQVDTMHSMLQKVGLDPYYAIATRMSFLGNSTSELASPGHWSCIPVS